MDERVRTDHTKEQILYKLIMGLTALALAVSAMFVWLEGKPMALIPSFIESLIIIPYTKIPRYWRMLGSPDIELIVLRSSAKDFGRLTTLPFKISGFVVAALVAVYLLTALAEWEVYKILLGLSVVAMIMATYTSVVIFDYRTRSFFGLWKAQSFFDSDRQKMMGTRFEYHEDETGIVNVKITDSGGHYFIDRKNYSPAAWERILYNAERVAQLNKH